jgi:uncharacterized protein
MARVDRALALPTDPLERIHVLDILRGLALLGMFIVHFHVNSSEPGGLDDLIRTAIWRLVETKSHGTFALLFGAGFAIQLRRAEARGRPFAGIYLRRLAVLPLFGLAAHAFFGFNVLLGYAVWGVPLLLMRSWSTRALLITAVFAAASVTLYRLAETQYLRLAAGPTASRRRSRRSAPGPVRSIVPSTPPRRRAVIRSCSRPACGTWRGSTCSRSPSCRAPP